MTRVDVLRWPLIGRALRWRYGRLAVQIPLVILAVLMLIDGFYGSRFITGDNAPENLATVAAWVHYRGLVIVALLLAGNLFCMACPFTLPRTLAKRLSISGRRAPRWMRNKWFAVGGLFTLFFLYEWLDLWSSPVLTAWVIVFYFVAAFVLEAAFKESAFCKYICPLGTFNFVYSTVSPTQIGVHSADVCRTCVGKECINGSYSPQPVILIDQISTEGRPQKIHQHTPQGTLGCGTDLFAPQIKSNLDCTLCLDCARACPHQNVGLFIRPPARELTDPDAWRKRWDIAFLVVALAFMGITNAFGMVSPVYALMERLYNGLVPLRSVGLSPQMIEGVVLLLIFGTGNLLIPAAVMVGLAGLVRWLTARKETLQQVAARFAPAFVPIGFGVWGAHYLFHFLIGVWSIVPVMQAFFGARPNYALVGIAPDSPVLALVEIVFLLGGFLGSLWVAQRIALKAYRRGGMLAFMPYAFIFLVMMLVALWIMGLPMEMRGTSALFG
ncbi:MAG: FesM [Phototrophicaceae bacterium]